MAVIHSVYFFVTHLMGDGFRGVGKWKKYKLGLFIGQLSKICFSRGGMISRITGESINQSNPWVASLERARVIFGNFYRKIVSAKESHASKAMRTRCLTTIAHARDPDEVGSSGSLAWAIVFWWNYARAFVISRSGDGASGSCWET
jgi:hypothetical protein